MLFRDKTRTSSLPLSSRTTPPPPASPAASNLGLAGAGGPARWTSHHPGQTLWLSWETVNIMDCNGDTALDWTGQSSAALYLSWLGAKCIEQNRFSEWEYGSKAIKSWGNHASTQEKLCWAIAADMR